MGNRNFGPGVGAKSWLTIINETTYGRLRIGTDMGALIAANETECYIPFVSESISHTINALESATLDPTRGALNSIRGTSDIGGDINVELRGQGYGQLIKMVMGEGASGSANYLMIDSCRGDIAIQIDGLHAIGDVAIHFKAPREIMADWATLFNVGGGTFSHIERDAVGLLVKKDLVFGAGDVIVSGNAGDPAFWHQIEVAALIAGDLPVKDNAWAFPTDAVKFAGCYLHYLELGTDLPVGLNVDVMRDIALFVYTGMKIGTWTMNFNANEIVKGTFSFIGREELCGGVLTSEVNNTIAIPLAVTNVPISDARIFCNYPGTTSKMMIGHEGDIFYTLPSPLSATLNTDAGMDDPVPVTIQTPASALGAIREGTDQVGHPALGWADWPSVAGRVLWGYFKGNAVVPMTGRACTAAGPADLRNTLVDLPPYSFFEANVLMSTGLVNDDPAAVVLPIKTAGRQGLEEIEVMNASFTLENNLYTDKYALGSRFRVKTIEQRRTLTGTLSFEFDNLVQYRKFFDGRMFSFIIKCISIDPDKGFCGTGTVDVPYSTCFYFPKCKYTGATPTSDGPDMIMTDMPFSAFVDPGSASAKPFTELAVWMTNARSIALWA